MLWAIETLAATAAAVGNQADDPDDAVEKAFGHRATHIDPTAHRTTRTFPGAFGFSRGGLHSSQSNKTMEWPRMRLQREP